MQPSGQVEIRLLGGFRVVLPDRRTAGPWARPSARRVVQVLALRERHRMGREELADLLFPDLAAERAANAVSRALSMARSALGPYEIVRSDRRVIWLAGAVEVDAGLQRVSLLRALALPPGPARDAVLVAGLEEKGRLLDEELYSDWASEARGELDGLRASARLSLARDRTSGHGRASTWDVVGAWSDVLAYDPANEEACSASVLACGAAGMRDLAVRIYHRTVAAIHELGLKPTRLLSDAYARALKEADEAPSRTEISLSPVRSFGRDAALAALRHLVGSDRGGEHGAVLVSGPAGIGKSHVLDAIGRELHAAGWKVVEAGAVSDDHRAPLRALRSVLGRLETGSAGPAVRQLAAGTGTAEATEGTPGARRRLLDDVVALFDSHAQARPLALMIDDVHWADVALREILVELAERGGGRRWIMILAARNDEAGPALTLPASAATLALVPLSPDGTAALVRATEPGLDEDGVTDCVHRSGGNPFFAIELARQQALGARNRQAQRQVPELIVELLDTRLARRSAEARRLLSLVALSGDETDIQTLLHLGAQPGVHCDADSTIRTIDELVAAHLLDERPDGVRLVHPLLRDAAVARLDPAQRAMLHKALAAVSVGEVAARHDLAAFEASGLRKHARRAAEAGFGAGRQARRLFADEAALELFGGGLLAFEAMADGDRDDLRASALEARCQLGDIHLQRESRADAERAYQAAMALAASDDERARVWTAMAGLAYRVGDFAQCVASYERGISSLREPSPLVRARLEIDLGWTYFRLGRAHEAVVVLERAAEALADDGDGPTRGHALDRLAAVLGVVGRAEEGLAVMQQAFEVVGPSGDERQLGVLHLHRATLYSALGRFGEALADAAAAQRVAAATTDSYNRSVVHWVTGHVHELRGDPVAALAERETELVLLEEVGNARNAALAHAARARLLRALGRADESEDATASARVLAGAQGDEAFSLQVEQQLLVLNA